MGPAAAVAGLAAGARASCLGPGARRTGPVVCRAAARVRRGARSAGHGVPAGGVAGFAGPAFWHHLQLRRPGPVHWQAQVRSEEHTSELQSLMRISYAVFCLKKKNKYTNNKVPYDITQNREQTASREM